VQADGYSLYLINLYSGQSVRSVSAMMLRRCPPTLRRRWYVSNYSFKLEIPLELDSSGYCSLPDMNASSQPQVQIQLNTVTPCSLLRRGTPASTLSWMSLSGWPRLITLRPLPPMWVLRLSGLLSARRLASAGCFTVCSSPESVPTSTPLVLVLRDATNARVDAWPLQDLTLWFDGVPVLMETLLERRDAMYTQFGVQVAGTSYPPTRLPPTGVIVYTFRDSIQSFISNGDTYDLLAPTTPATLLEVSGTFSRVLVRSPSHCGWRAFFHWGDPLYSPCDVKSILHLGDVRRYHAQIFM